MITAAAIKCGFSGGLVVDYPNSTKAKKYFHSIITIPDIFYVCLLGLLLRDSKNRKDWKMMENKRPMKVEKKSGLNSKVLEKQNKREKGNVMLHEF